MSTYTQIIYHLIFSTKNRKRCLDESRREDLYKYIWGILKNKKCHLYRINGVEDHLHLVFQLHPSVSLSSLVKDIKVASSSFIQENDLFNRFDGWQKGYGAFTYSIKEKKALIDYVKNQEEHHRKTSFKEEFIRLLNENNIEFDERYLL